jgi:hypothetical protein
VSADEIFAELEDGTFTNTPLSEYLRSGVPGSVRDLGPLFATDWHWRAHGALGDACPGVNLIGAASFLAAVGDANRFLTSRKLVAYLGLDPKVRQSGQAPARSGRISKRGSASARWALVEAAWSAYCDPGRCGYSISASGGDAGTARRSWPPPASWRFCSGACSLAARTTPTSNRH